MQRIFNEFLSKSLSLAKILEILKRLCLSNKIINKEKPDFIKEIIR